MHEARYLLVTLVMIGACAPDSAREPSDRTDTVPVAASASAHPGTIPKPLDCPGVDSLRLTDTLTFQPAWAFRSHPAVEPEYFCFGLSDGVYRIGTKGAGQRAGSQRPRPFQLEWQDAATTGIERLLVRPHGGDVLLAFEVSDGESGAAELVRLERQTLRQHWHAHLPSFNLSPPLVADSAAYVAAMGFVGRVNLESGQYDWHVRDLYDYQTGHFNSVDSIILSGDTVAFAAAGAGRPPRILLFHRESGVALGQREGAPGLDRLR